MVETALGLAALACVGVLGVAVALARTRQLPAEVLVRMAEIEATRLADRETVETLIERAEDAFDRAERKRRSAAAAAAKANGVGKQEEMPLTREEQLRAIREKTGVWT